MSKKFYIKIDKPIEVGDLVRCVSYDDDECEPGDVRKVSRLGVSTDQLFYVYGSKEPHLKKDWEPVQVIENDRAEMERAVGEMVVELMDRAEKKKVMPRIYCYKNKNTDKTTRVYFDDEGYDAKLHPDDTWDTLTGVFVALSKAAGRKLPNWIYGEIDEGGQR